MYAVAFTIVVKGKIGWVKTGQKHWITNFSIVDSKAVPCTTIPATGFKENTFNNLFHHKHWTNDVAQEFFGKLI